MKGIIKYNQKFYKKSKDRNLVKGDLIKLECSRNSDYFQYNGIHEVADNNKCIHIKNYKEEIRDGKLVPITLCIKLGYNTFDYTKLVETKRKKQLPSCAKEEQEY